MPTPITPLPYGFSRTLDLSFDEVVPLVRGALDANGFGILSEVDVAAALKKKPGIDTEPHLILGTCDPSLAHRGLAIDPDLGLLLPCKVTLRCAEGGTPVGVIDPDSMAAMTGKDALRPIADKAATRLRVALAAPWERVGKLGTPTRSRGRSGYSLPDSRGHW